MKKLRVLPIAFSLCVSLAVFSQTTPDGEGRHAGGGVGRGYGQGRGAGMMNPDVQLERRSRELNLTDDQKAKIKPILQDTAKQRQELRQDSSMSEQDKRAKVEQIHQNAMSQVGSILTPGRLQKLEAMHERHSRGHEHDYAAENEPRPQQQ